MAATHQEMVKALNEEFDATLADMKPFVLKLQLKSERQRCALWIKKLCEAHQYSGIEGRRLRNLYSRVLLTLLSKGIMEGPFLHKPPDGSLPSLPVYLTDMLSGKPIQVKNVPDWVADLSTDFVLLAGGDAPPIRTSTRVSPSNRETKTSSSNQENRLRSGEMSASEMSAALKERRDTRRFEEDLDSAVQLPESNGRERSPNKLLFSRTGGLGYDSPLDEVTNRRVAAKASFQFSSDEDDDVISDIEYRPPRSPIRVISPVGRRSPVRRSRSPVIIREHARLLERQFDKDVGMRVKVIEARMHEEKLKLQQRNDEEIQKILDRKNAEIEEVKTHYQKKLQSSEDNVAKLEKKVSAVLKDAQIVRENKDSQIYELKKIAEESAQSKNNSLEKKLHDLIADHEQEKIEMQKAQTNSIQELMDETSERLQKMEDDYRKQSHATAETIRELEKRIQSLTLEAQRVSSSKQQLEQLKIELETKLEQLTIDNNEYKIKYEALEREQQKIMEDHTHTLELLKEKHESQLNFARKEHQLTTTKNNDTIMSLEQQLLQSKQVIHELEAQRQRQLRELETSYTQDKLHQDNLHEKKVRSLQKEMDLQETEAKKRLRSAEKQASEQERELSRLQEKLQQQSVQAEQALADLRQQVEKQQEQVFAEMKKHTQQVDEELTQAKQAKAEQAEQFEQKIQEMQTAHNEQLQALNQTSDHEQKLLQVNFNQIKENMTSTHAKEVQCLKSNFDQEKHSLEEMLRQRRKEYDNKISEQAETIHELKEELAQSDNLRKQQLMEIGLVREEDMQRMVHEHERALERLKSELEREKHHLQKHHAAEMESSVEKTSSKLKSLENDYSQRISLQVEQVAELQLQVEQLKAEKHKLTDQMESKILANQNRFEEEKRTLRKQSAATVLSLNQEVESLKMKIRKADRDLQDLEADHEEDLVQLRLEYEERMAGLMPSDAREQLESTISSLKNQVNTLKQRINILQDS